MLKYDNVVVDAGKSAKCHVHLLSEEFFLRDGHDTDIADILQIYQSALDHRRYCRRRRQCQFDAGERLCGACTRFCTCQQQRWCNSIVFIENPPEFTVDDLNMTITIREVPWGIKFLQRLTDICCPRLRFNRDLW